MTIRFKQFLLTAICGLLFSTALLQPAQAEMDEEKMYIFGTRVALLSPTQLGGPPAYSWWADMLPMPYTHATGWIVQEVNAQRESQGNDSRVDYRNYPISLGGELQTDKGWEYYIDFQGMFPADVDFVLSSFPIEGVLSDLAMEIRPVSFRSYYASTQDGSPMTLDLPGGEITFTTEDSFSGTRNRISAQLNDFFGEEINFDLSMNRYYSAAGYDNFDMNVTIYMDDSYQYGGYPTEYSD